MGYSTEFRGKFLLDKYLTEDQADYLLKFADTRRMFRSEKATATLVDSLREAVHLPAGIDGEFYVGDDAVVDSVLTSVVDYNEPPRTQPGLWCQWIPTKNRDGFEWNDVEKFYNYKEWFAYICEKFLTPWGYKVSGSVRWRGEDWGDEGEMDGREIQLNAARILTTPRIKLTYSDITYQERLKIWEEKYLQSFFLSNKSPDCGCTDCIIGESRPAYEKLYTRFKTPGDPLNAYAREEPLRTYLLPEVLILLFENDLIKTENL